MTIPEREFERLKELCVICGAKVIMLIFIPSKRLLNQKKTHHRKLGSSPFL